MPDTPETDTFADAETQSALNADELAQNEGTQAAEESTPTSDLPEGAAGVNPSTGEIIY